MIHPNSGVLQFVILLRMKLGHSLSVRNYRLNRFYLQLHIIAEIEYNGKQ